MSDQVTEINAPPTQAPPVAVEEEHPPVKKNEAAIDKSADLLEGRGMASMDMLMDISLQLTVELGRTQMTVRQVLDLQKGSVVELNRIAGDAVDIYVNDRLLARGEVVVVDDKFGVRITELVTPVRDVAEV